MTYNYEGLEENLMSNKNDVKVTEADIVPETEVVQANEKSHAPTTMESTHDRLIEIAINAGADIASLERLFDLKVKHEENEAKKAYHEAMSKFKELCPAIYKTKAGHNSKYAPLSDIIAQIKSAMNTCGLSQAWTTSQEGKLISVTCVVTHKLGHSEQTTLMADPDTSGSKNAIQSVGSAVSYLQRYTLKSLLGIAEGDDDGNGSGPVKTITDEQVMELDCIIEDNGLNKANFIKWAKIESLSDIKAENFAGARAALLKSAKS